MPDPSPPSFELPKFDTLETLPDPTFGDDGRTVYTDIEFAMPTGYRPLRLDLTVPPVGAPVPVVLFIHGGAFMFGSRRSHPLLPPIRKALLDLSLIHI